MMDADFGFDDKIGKKELDLDGLPLNTKIAKTIAFNAVIILMIQLVVEQIGIQNERNKYTVTRFSCDCNTLSTSWK